jgi:hypothetical protein
MQPQAWRYLTPQQETEPGAPEFVDLGVRWGGRDLSVLEDVNNDARRQAHGGRVDETPLPIYVTPTSELLPRPEPADPVDASRNPLVYAAAAALALVLLR